MNTAPMLPYQVIAKDFIKTHPKCGLFLDMGLGKAMDDDTVMPTPKGFRRLGDLAVGDPVFGSDGRPHTVTAVFKHPGKPAYRVTLSDGRSFVCCDEHLIPVYVCGAPAQMVPTPLSAIMDDYVVDEDGTRLYNYAIPRADMVDYPRRDHTISPFAMGLILRYGLLHDGELKFLPDRDMHVNVRAGRLIYQQFGVTLYDDSISITIGPDGEVAPGTQLRDKVDARRLHDYLVDMGYKDGKPFDSIPEEYQADSVLNRRDLICGFLAIDLSGEFSGFTFKTSAESQSLVDDLKRMVWSMAWGAASKWRPKLKRADVEVRLDRCTYPTDPKRPSAFHEMLTIVDVKPVGARDMTCFTVDSPDHCYLVNDYIVTHNTRITLQALYEQNPRNHVLIVAPKNIARSTWLDEIAKWGLPLRTESLICNERFKDLSRKARLAKYDAILQTPPSLYFINRELLHDLVAHMPVVNGQKVWPFPSVVVDELQSFKNYGSQRFKALKTVLPAVRQFIGLTGTPTPEGLMDLWPEIYLMDNGARLGPNITWYRRTFFQETLRVNGYPVKWRPLPGAEDEIYRRIGDLVISMKNTGTLPPVTYNPFPVYLDEDELAEYKRFAKTAVLDLGDDRNPVTAVNAAVLKNKLVQMASGTIYVETGSHEYLVIHQKKLEALRYIIDNTSDGILVAYHFKSELDQITKYIPEAVPFDGSPAMQDEWNAGHIKVMLIQPASAGHGLNLQYGGHTLVWYTINPNLEEYLQTNARLPRPGQTKPVVIHHLLADRTVDRAMLALLNQKDMSQESLLAAVRVAIDDIMS